MSDDKNNPWDDDPFAENPEAEFAPTQAMTAIPGPGEPGAPPSGGAEFGQRQTPQAQGPGAPGPSTAAQGADATGPSTAGGSQQPGHPSAGRSSSPSPSDTGATKIGPSAIISAVGGFFVCLAFFLPMFGGAYIFEDLVSESSAGLMNPRVVFELAEEFAEDDEQFQASRDFFEAAGFDEIWEQLEDADEAERETALKEWGLSNFQLVRMFQVGDFNSDSLDADTEDKRAFRTIWVALIWMFVTGVVALAIAALRRFQALNAFQVAWNGLYGLNYTFIGIVALAVSETKTTGGIQVDMFVGAGGLVLLLGGLLMWISAFAGLSKTNWWKAPLIGIGLIIGTGVLSAIPIALV